MDTDPWLFGEPLDDNWVACLPLSKLVEGKGLSFEAQGFRLALFLIQGKVFAIDELCPHANGPLSRGWLEGECLVCPLHRWKFDLATGQCLTNPNNPINQYVTRVDRTGIIWVKKNNERSSLYWHDPDDPLGKD